MGNDDGVIPNLHDLPVEVLSEIASNLDFKDLFSFQQTSKKLQAAADAHTVWLTLAQEYSAQHFHFYRPESGPLKDLNTGDLRDWIRRRLIFDHVWKTQNLQPRIRELPDELFATPVLLPGGRWLLVGELDGSVCYYDLDFEDLERHDLIRPSEDIKNRQYMGGLKFDVVVQDSPGLKVNIAMSCKTFRPKTKCLYIWQVEVKDGKSLTAELLASVPIYLDTENSALVSLGRHTLAQDIYRSPSPTWIEVYWWKKCSTTKVLRSAFPVRSRRRECFLIGEDKFLCMDYPTTVELYNIPEPSYTQVEPGVEIRHPSTPAHNPIWSHTFSNDGRMYYSPMYRDGAIHRLVVSTNQGIWGLVVSTEKGDIPSIIQLSTFSNEIQCAPAIRKALALQHSGVDGFRINYNWDGGGGGGVYQHNNTSQSQPWDTLGQPSFDEQSGRFVWCLRWGIMIVDLLPEVGGDFVALKNAD